MSKKWLFRLSASLLATGWWLGATPALAAEMDIQGSLPRDLSTGQFEITVTVSKVTQTEYEAGLNDVNAASRFDIKIGSNNTPLKFDFEEGYDDEGNRFYITVQDEEPAQPDDDLANHYKYEYTFLITDITGGTNLEAEAGDDNELGVIVDFYLGGTDTTPVFSNENNPKIIKRELYVITQAPAFDALGLTGVYESLIVNYGAVSTVTTSDGTARAPSSVKVISVDTSVITGDRTFPAKLFVDEDDSQDEDAECDYTAANIDGGACITCPDNVYLNTTQMSQIDGVRVVTGDASEGSATITGLDNRSEDDPVYAVFMQYEPSGIDQSSCLIGRPTEDITLTELNGAGEAKILDIRCFIASAAYGSALHADINLFRAFRDRVLLKFELGEWFVHRYYEYSPPLAAAIEKSPAAQATVRWLLGIPAAILDIFYDDDEIERP